MLYGCTLKEVLSGAVGAIQNCVIQINNMFIIALFAAKQPAGVWSAAVSVWTHWTNHCHVCMQDLQCHCHC